MINGFITIGILQLLAVIAPGPDFAVVVKNTLIHKRSAGLLTTAGITCGVTFHLAYCLLGFALIISQSLLLFNTIKYLGAAYLIYIGIRSLASKKASPIAEQIPSPQSQLSVTQAFRQGIFCNIFNPKATLFFLGLFTLVINPHTPASIQIGYALEIIAITFFWFSLLVMLLSHPPIRTKLSTFQYIIDKVIGLVLVIFGTELIFFQRH